MKIFSTVLCLIWGLCHVWFGPSKSAYIVQFDTIMCIPEELGTSEPCEQDEKI